MITSTISCVVILFETSVTHDDKYHLICMRDLGGGGYLCYGRRAEIMHTAQLLPDSLSLKKLLNSLIDHTRTQFDTFCIVPYSSFVTV